MKVLNFNQDEVLLPADLTAISTNARNALDEITEGALGWPAHYVRFTVAKDASPDSVVIAPGEFYNGEAIYKQELAETLNLQTYKPDVDTDRRWVALLARADNPGGVEVYEIRQKETAADHLTETAPINENMLKRIERRTSIIVQTGAISPAPAIKPTVAVNDCAICFVLLSTNGVEQIVANEKSRVKSVYEIEGRVASLEVEVDRLSEATTTISTDLGGVANELANLKGQAIPQHLIDQLVRDQSIDNRLRDVDDGAKNYVFDQALVKDFWDLTHQSAQFRIREGIWPPYANQAQHILRALNQSDPAFKPIGKYVLPAHTEVVRLEVPPGDASENISNAVHTNKVAHQWTESHTNIRYGETIHRCENAAGWGDLQGRREGEIFTINGQEFIDRGIVHHHNWEGHKIHAIQYVIRETVAETYSGYKTEEVGLSGAIYWQSFPNAKFMMALGVNLWFTRVGTAGDVTLCLSEVRADGVPNFKKILAHVTVDRDGLKEGEWTRFGFGPTVLEPGKKYAWFTVTTGNHEISKTTGNAFPDGTAGKCLDGIWSQGSIMEDYSHQVIGARFENSRAVMEMQPLTLANGMTEFEMVYQSLEAGGASLEWEVKAQGVTDWELVEPARSNPLRNLPPLIQLRAVFVGSPDFMPAFIQDNHAIAICGRMAQNMQAITKPINTAVASDSWKVIVNMDHFDSDHHTVTPKLIVNGTIEDADSITIGADPAKPSRTKVVANFSLSSAVSQAIVRLDSATDEVTNVAFGQDIQVVAL